MTDPWSSAKIRQFEQVMAAPTVALLRVEAKASRRRSGEATPPPVLLADDGEGVVRFPPIPSSPDERGTLRVAYSVPAAAITQQTVFSLRLSDGSVLSLPRPSVGTARGAQVPAPAGGPPPAGERRSDPLPKLAGLSAALAEAERQAEDARLEAAAAEQLSSGLKRERDDAVATAERLQRENERLQAGLDELEIWRAELERRLAATTTELGAAATRLRENEQELTRLRTALAETEGGAAPGGSDVADLLRAADRVAVAARELAEARARIAGGATAPAEPAAPAESTAPAEPTAPAESTAPAETAPAETAPAEPAAPVGADLEQLLRRAAAEAGEQAARELADARADEP